MAVLVPQAACGSGGGIPVINFYYAPEQNIGTVVDECNQQAADHRERRRNLTLDRPA